MGTDCLFAGGCCCSAFPAFHMETLLLGKACGRREEVADISPSCSSSSVGTSALEGAGGSGTGSLLSQQLQPSEELRCRQLPSAAPCFSALKKKRAPPKNVHSTCNTLVLGVLHAGDTTRLLGPKVKKAAAFIL